MRRTQALPTHVVAAVLTAILPASDLCAGPSASIHPLAQDFGHVFRGEIPKLTFVIGNDGDEPLSIAIPTVPCPCIMPAARHVTILPGEQYALAVRYDTKDYRGRIETHVPLVTSDPNRRLVRLGLSGEISDLFSVSPSRIPLGRVPADATIEFEIALTSAHIPCEDIQIDIRDDGDSSRLMIQPLACNTPAAVASRRTVRAGATQPTSAPRRHDSDAEPASRKVTCVASTGTRLGPVVRTLTLAACKPGSTVTVAREIRIGATVTDENLDSHELRFGVVHGGESTEPPSKQVRLLQPIAGPLGVTEMPPFLRVADRKHANGTGLVFTIAPEALTQSRLYEGDVTITYGQSGSQRVRQIPVSVVVISSRGLTLPTRTERPGSE